MTTVDVNFAFKRKKKRQFQRQLSPRGNKVREGKYSARVRKG